MQTHAQGAAGADRHSAARLGGSSAVRGARRRAGRWLALAGMASSMFLFQQAGCAIDPDIILATSLQILGDVGLFVLQNAIYGL